MSRPNLARVRLSVDEFLVYPAPDGKAELVRGELRLSPPPGSGHGRVIAALVTRLASHVEDHRLGYVFAGSGFELLELPRTVRAPDIAFVRADRLPADGLGPRFLGIAPDLAIEVVSPSETPARLREKLDDYRVSKVALVWLIDARERTVTIIDKAGLVRRLAGDDVLDGGDVVPGFSCAIRALFVGLA